MAETRLIRCSSCGSTNRVPLEKVEQGLTPVCGRCKARMPIELKPVTVTPESSPFCQTGCAGGAQAICQANNGTPSEADEIDAACQFSAANPFDGGFNEPD